MIGLLHKRNHAAALLKIEDKVVRDKYNKAKASMIKDQADAMVQQRYDKAIKEADALMGQKKLEEAKAKYAQAQLFDETSIYPKAQIKKIDEELNASLAVDEKYNAAMAKGEASMVRKDYLDAIAQFNKALSVKPTEPLPVARAKEAQRLIESDTSDKETQYEKIFECRSKEDERKGTWTKLKSF